MAIENRAMEKEVLEARNLLKCLVNSAKLVKKTAANGDIRVLRSTATENIQMTNLAKWCELLGVKYFRTDWGGNTHCNTNHDELWFEWDGVRFFELVDKKDEEE